MKELDEIIDIIKDYGYMRFVFVVKQLNLDLKEKQDLLEVLQHARFGIGGNHKVTTLNPKDCLSDEDQNRWDNMTDAIDFLTKEIEATQTKPEQPQMPCKLATDEANALFAKIQQCKPDGSLFRWDGSASLFGYFVDVASGYLDVRPSNDRLPWKIFKIAFQMSDANIETAKQAVNAYRNKALNKPEGWREIYNATDK